LILEIWTNGTVTPEMALVEASKILRKHLNPFVQYFELGSDTANEGRRFQAAARQRQGADRSGSAAEAGHDDPGAGPVGPRNNCLESAKIGYRARAGEEDRRGSLEGPQLRQDVAARSEAQAGDLGLSLGMDLDAAASGAAAAQQSAYVSPDEGEEAEAQRGDQRVERPSLVS
jgi:DNA-directed RNA polymerase subunit alpha